MPSSIGRPRTCECGACPKCRARDRAREWWRNLTPDAKQAKLAARDPERVRANDRARYYRHWEDRRASTDAYQATHTAQVDVAKAAWVERNPEKRRAHNIVRAAVKTGRLVPEPCEVCGDKAEAHHDDYDAPLEVRWLCRQHHAELHRRY
jgi:hypothetical protein